MAEGEDGMEKIEEESNIFDLNEINDNPPDTMAEFVTYASTRSLLRCFNYEDDEEIQKQENTTHEEEEKQQDEDKIENEEIFEISLASPSALSPREVFDNNINDYNHSINKSNSNNININHSPPPPRSFLQDINNNNNNHYNSNSRDRKIFGNNNNRKVGNEGLIVTKLTPMRPKTASSILLQTFHSRVATASSNYSLHQTQQPQHQHCNSQPQQRTYIKHLAPKQQQLLIRPPRPSRRIIYDYNIENEIKQWCKKRRLPDGSKIFHVTCPPYEDMRVALLRRGWVENNDPYSSIFHFKFTLNYGQLFSKTLQQQQIINHFENSKVLTTKSGLNQSLRNLKWYMNVASESFFPPCFELSKPEEMSELIDLYRYISAENYLRLFKQLYSLRHSPISSVSTKPENNNNGNINSHNDNSYNTNNNSRSDQSRLLPISKFKMADWCLAIVSAKLAVLNHSDIDERHWPPLDIPQTAMDWKNFLLFASAVINFVNSAKGSRVHDPKQDEEGEEEGEIEEGKERSEVTARDLFPFSSDKHRLHRAVELLDEIQKKQPERYSLSSAFRNVWILKPGGLSRGRGIELCNNLEEILLFASKEGKYIAQKYIERPLLIYERKFDFRQWVLVTGINPLSIWKYRDSYLRFTSSNYNVNNLQDKYLHLCNNSIQVECEFFGSSFHTMEPALLEGFHLEGNMWHCDQFASYLTRYHQRPNLWDQISKDINSIIIWSFHAGMEAITNRKNTFELYGYDLMLDEEFHPWLIEINSSPTLEHSTTITTPLVKEMVEDLLKLIIDEDELNKKMKSNVAGNNNNSNNINNNNYKDIGKFILLHRGEVIDTQAQLNANTSTLKLSGNTIKIHPTISTIASTSGNKDNETGANYENNNNNANNNNKNNNNNNNWIVNNSSKLEEEQNYMSITKKQITPLPKIATAKK